MGLSADQMHELTDALMAAFYSQANLKHMVRFRLNENLDIIAGGANLKEITFNLVQWAEAQEKIEELLIGARKDNSGNSKLKSISQKLLATALEATPDQLESIVQRSIHFVDIEHWLEEVRKCSRAVCRIEFPAGNAQGSGFLLGSNIVISNYHVIADILHQPDFNDGLVLRFDYKTDKDSKLRYPGVERHLAGTQNGILTNSPMDKLDYVLLQIHVSENDHPARLALKPIKYVFAHREPLCIVQHPDGNPQKIAFGSISQIPTSQNHVHYTTNTLPGSSGSPCINSEGAVVALHQGGYDGKRNMGILFSAILADLQKKNLLSVLDME